MIGNLTYDEGVMHVRVRDPLYNYTNTHGLATVQIDEATEEHLGVGHGDRLLVGRPHDDVFYAARVFTGMPFPDEDSFGFNQARVEDRLLKRLDMPASKTGLEAAHIIEARSADQDVPVVIRRY